VQKQYLKSKTITGKQTRLHNRRSHLMAAGFFVFAALFFSNISLANSSKKELPTCAYISSYAPGYHWQDGIERGLKKSLNNQCRLRTFFMNTKKVFDEHKLVEIGNQAANFIRNTKPDVVVISDDNAVKYVLAPHFKNSDLPFVFCGINNSGKGYGLPYKNTSGMIEKDPNITLLKFLFNINPSKTHVAYMTTHGTTASKDVANFHQVVEKLKIESSAFRVHNEADWRKIYKDLQDDPKVDIILLSNKAAFETWDHKKNVAWVSKHNKKITVSNHVLMMPYVALGMTKVPDEQGYWAGQTALEILNGTPVQQIAVVPNRNFQLWINPSIANTFKDILPENIFSQSLIYSERVSN